MNCKKLVIIISVFINMAFVLGTLNFLYSPDQKKDYFKKKGIINKKNINLKDSKNKIQNNSGIVLSNVKFVKPNKHTYITDNAKDNKRYNAIIKNLGVVVK